MEDKSACVQAKVVPLHFTYLHIHMKKITLIFALCMLVISTQAQLSSKARVSILTCGPGLDFYESFGHSAIRIQDDSLEMDITFNYGVFDFDEPHFYLKFFMGQLPYMLAAESTGMFLWGYKYEGRSVMEQELNMTMQEKNRLYTLLAENYKPENRYYNYDFFRDNCATRVRDMIQQSMTDSIFSRQQMQQPLTYRQLYYAYTDSLLWWRFAIDMLLGVRTDKKLNAWEYMYIPFDIQYQADTCLYHGKAGGIINREGYLLPSTLTPPRRTPVTPVMAFSLVLAVALIITWYERKKGTYVRIFDILLYLSLALLSMAIMFLWFISNHYATKYNFNILWLNPLAWVLLFMLRKTPRPVIYAMWICALLGLGCFGLWPQSFNIAVLPILCTIIIRLWALLKTKAAVQKS